MFQPAGPAPLHPRRAVRARRWCCCGCCATAAQVRVRGAAGGRAAAGCRPSAIRPVGFDPGLQLLPWPRARARGLPAAAGVLHAAGRSSCSSTCAGWTPRRAIDGRALRARLRLGAAAAPGRAHPPGTCSGCTARRPSTSSACRRTPSCTTSLGDEHLLRALGAGPPTHAEVYSVDTVTGLQAGRNERRDYRPFFEFAHTAGGRRGAPSTGCAGRTRRSMTASTRSFTRQRRGTPAPSCDRGDALHRPDVHQPLAARAAAGGRLSMPTPASPRGEVPQHLAR